MHRSFQFKLLELGVPQSTYKLNVQGCRSDKK